MCREPWPVIRRVLISALPGSLKDVHRLAEISDNRDGRAGQDALLLFLFTFTGAETHTMAAITGAPAAGICS